MNPGLTFRKIRLLSVILATVLFGTTLRTSLASSVTVDWLSYAKIAWKYYSPGIGVNPDTGIHRGNLAWNAITDWDTGGHIIAVMDAHNLGLIPYDGEWGFRYRIERILRYLLTRQLGINDNIQNWPYRQYYWDGRPLDSSHRYTDSSDSGRLLYALDLLRKYDPSFQNQIQSVFQRCKTAYDVLSTHVDARVHYYGTLDAVGFTAFGYNKSYVISAFQNWSSPFVVVEGQSLPQTETTAEPTLHGILELGLGGNFFEFSRRVYEAQKSRWASTTRLSAWSEGGYPEPGYIYEWVLTPNGESWVITGSGTKLNIEPLMYAKVAFGYLAIFGNNPYTLSLFNAAKNLQHPECGFGEATMEDGTSAISLWKTNTGGFYSDKTNQIVIAAARYALSGQTTKTSTSTLTITVTTTVAETPTTSSPITTRRCVIASAAYGSELANPIQSLREFRDTKILPTFAGQQFMRAFNAFYYSFSPTAASMIAESPILSHATRTLLHPLVAILTVSSSLFNVLSSQPELAVLASGTIASGLLGLVYLAPIMVVIRIWIVLVGRRGRGQLKC